MLHRGEMPHGASSFNSAKKREGHPNRAEKGESETRPANEPGISTARTVIIDKDARNLRAMGDKHAAAIARVKAREAAVASTAPARPEEKPTETKIPRLSLWKRIKRGFGSGTEQETVEMEERLKARGNEDELSVADEENWQAKTNPLGYDKTGKPIYDFSDLNYADIKNRDENTGASDIANASQSKEAARLVDNLYVRRNLARQPHAKAPLISAGDENLSGGWFNNQPAEGYFVSGQDEEDVTPANLGTGEKRTPQKTIDKFDSLMARKAKPSNPTMEGRIAQKERLRPSYAKFDKIIAATEQRQEGKRLKQAWTEDEVRARDARLAKREARQAVSNQISARANQINAERLDSWVDSESSFKVGDRVWYKKTNKKDPKMSGEIECEIVWQSDRAFRLRDLGTNGTFAVNINNALERMRPASKTDADGSEQRAA